MGSGELDDVVLLRAYREAIDHHRRYKLVSTGGTASALEKAGYTVTRVEELTSFPEMVSSFPFAMQTLFVDMYSRS